MTKVYLAHSISTTADFNDSKRVANEIRALGFDVYAAAENSSINDKTNDPTPIDIYNGDVYQILSADIFVVNLSGGLQDGTISEVGVVAGYNEMLTDVIPILTEAYPKARTIPIVGYTSNARLTQPQFYLGIPSASANHLVLGMVEKWGEFVGGEVEMLAKLSELQSEGIVL